MEVRDPKQPTKPSRPTFRTRFCNDVDKPRRNILRSIMEPTSPKLTLQRRSQSVNDTIANEGSESSTNDDSSPSNIDRKPFSLRSPRLNRITKRTHSMPLPYLPKRQDSSLSILQFSEMNRLSQRFSFPCVPYPDDKNSADETQRNKVLMNIVDRLPSNRHIARELSSENLTATTVATSFENFDATNLNNSGPWDRPLIEVTPGCSIPLRGLEETVSAFYLGKVLVTSCLACQKCFACINSASIAVCPHCRSFSEVEDPDQTPEAATYRTIGLGLCLDVLSNPNNLSF